MGNLHEFKIAGISKLFKRNCSFHCELFFTSMPYITIKWHFHGLVLRHRLTMCSKIMHKNSQYGTANHNWNYNKVFYTGRLKN